MSELINTSERKARNPHVCNYCGNIITKGETYTRYVCRDDDIYTWNTHKKCDFIAKELWEYIEPDDGMTGDDFQNGVASFCRQFICPSCDKSNTTDYDCIECDADKIFCVDKVYDLFQTYSFMSVGRDGWNEKFRLEKRKTE